MTTSSENKESVAKRLVVLTMEAAIRCEKTLQDPYWDSTGENAGLYCKDCSERFFPDSIDGGWASEEDYAPFCECCNRPLDFTLTEAGVLYELEAIENSGINSDHDAYCVHRVMNAGGHPLLTERCGDFHYKPELLPRIEAILRRYERQLTTPTARR